MTRKPGRPPGAKNKPKQAREPSRMGRPSPWSQPTALTIRVRVPQHVADAWRDPEFKRQVDKLAVDFATPKS